MIHVGSAFGFSHVFSFLRRQPTEGPCASIYYHIDFII